MHRRQASVTVSLMCAVGLAPAVKTDSTTSNTTATSDVKVASVISEELLVSRVVRETAIVDADPTSKAPNVTYLGLTTSSPTCTI